MNDVRDEALGALLERAAVGIGSVPVDRLPEVLWRGSRRRAGRFTATAAAVAVFVGALSWAGLSMRERNETIPTDLDDWRTFASLEGNGWTIQVPPPWKVQELPSCPNAPKRIGVIVTNRDFEFLNPRGESPQCEDRLVFKGFPRDGVALAFMPRGSIPGIFGALPDTTLPLAPQLLIPSTGIRGGPAESSLGIFLDGDWLGMLRRYEGPRAKERDVLALDRMLSSFRVRGAPRWVEEEIVQGGLAVTTTHPEPWKATTFRGPTAEDVPTPLMLLTSTEIGGGSCQPFLRVSLGSFGEFGVAVFVADGSSAFTIGGTGLKPRPASLRFQDAKERRTVRCGNRLRVLSFVFEEADRPIYVDLAASEAVYREQPEMLLYILNSIQVEET